MADQIDPRAVLTLIQERVMIPRVGLSMFREMDRDIFALRQAAEALTLLIDHDHEDQCCREHGTHSIPHKGCILR